MGKGDLFNWRMRRMGFGDSLVRNLGLGVPAKQEAGFWFQPGSSVVISNVFLHLHEDFGGHCCTT